MKAPTRFLLLSLGLAAAAAAVLAPQRDEWFAVLLDQGRQARVIATLEPRLAREPNNPGLLALLARAHTAAKQYAQAASLMERYIALRPQEGDAYARLADLYGKTHRTAEQLEMLQHAVTFRPVTSTVETLAKLYQQTGRSVEERALLVRFEHMLTVDSGLLQRAAALRRNAGDLEGAIGLLSRPEVIAPPARTGPQAEARLFLAATLVEAERSADAVAMAQRWITEWQEPWLASRVLQEVALHAPETDADRLADAVAVLHPEIRLFLVRTLAEMGAVQVGHHLLTTWLDANPAPSEIEIAAFLSMCLEQDVVDVVWRTFAHILNRDSASDAADRFAKAMAATFGIGSLAPFWAHLPADLLRRDPLLSAQIAFNAGDTRVATWLLSRVNVDALGPADRQIWFDLLLAAASPPEAAMILRDQAAHGHLPVAVVVEYAQRAFDHTPRPAGSTDPAEVGHAN